MLVILSALAKHRSRGPALAAMALASGLAAVGAGPTWADTGLKVPRFVSLKSDTVNLRRGPGRQYPILWVYKRKALPLEVIREHDTWRQVRDWEGTKGWVHQATLSGRRTIVVIGRVRTLRSEPAADAAPVARAESGVVGRLLACRGGWCRVHVSTYRGWLRRSDFWGVYTRERVR